MNIKNYMMKLSVLENIQFRFYYFDYNVILIVYFAKCFNILTIL